MSSSVFRLLPVFNSNPLVVSICFPHIPYYSYLLYRQECFSGKWTTRKVHTKLHPGLEWRIFHILTSEDIDDVISPPLTLLFMLKYSCPYNKRQITRWLEDMNFIFSW